PSASYAAGRAFGRVWTVSPKKGMTIALCRKGGETHEAKITNLYGYEGLKRVEIQEAGPGDIVAVAGLEEVEISETISDLLDPRPLPLIHVDEPTISMVFAINSSPMS